MKLIKRLMTVLAAAMMVILPCADAITAEAAEPVTYAVKYLDNKWCFEANTSVFDDKGSYREIYYLREQLKDGDTVVIYNTAEKSDNLDLGGARLGNLTYAATTFTIVYAGGVDECFVNAGSTGTINCDVKTAHVYDTSVFNFNKNVGELFIHVGDSVKSSVGAAGTVGHLKVIKADGNSIFDYYDFEAGILAFDKGTFKPARVAYKTYEEHLASLPEGEAEPEAQALESNDSEYDDVPKTGQNNLYLWFLGAAAVCFAGGRILKATEK